jgi:hypothetical protein
VKRLITEARLIPIIAGTLKRFDLFRMLLPKKTGGSIKSRYCYSIWLRHLYFLTKHNNNKIPFSVAELGPGDSLGVGISALLSGAEHYYALDVIKFWQPERNIQILNELLDLFNSKAGIPDNIEFPKVAPILEDYSFPDRILTEERLKTSLAPERITRIRKELGDPVNSTNTFVKFKIPWNNPDVINAKTIDFILSQAVMEHVDDLENAYCAMKCWLTDSGFISHTVDFASHGLTKRWNGHWTLSDFEWKIVRGGRIYAINRQPLSSHLKLLNDNNFTILKEEIHNNKNIFNRTHLSKSFQGLSEEDLNTTGVYFLAKNKI